MKSISQEKRELIVSAYERGEKSSAIALWLNISVRSVNRITQLHKQTGTIIAKPFTGRRTLLTTEQLSQIKETVEMQSDITLEELIISLNLPIKKSRLSVLLIRMGFSFKKRLSTLKSNSVRMFSQSALDGNQSKLD